MMWVEMFFLLNLFLFFLFLFLSFLWMMGSALKELAQPLCMNSFFLFLLMA